MNWFLFFHHNLLLTLIVYQENLKNCLALPGRRAVNRDPSSI